MSLDTPVVPQHWDRPIRSTLAALMAVVSTMGIVASYDDALEGFLGAAGPTQYVYRWLLIVAAAAPVYWLLTYGLDVLAEHVSRSFPLRGIAFRAACVLLVAMAGSTAAGGEWHLADWGLLTAAFILEAILADADLRVLRQRREVRRRYIPRHAYAR